MLVALEFYDSNIIEIYEVDDISVENLMSEFDHDHHEFICPELINKAEAQVDSWYDLIDINDLDADCFDEDGEIRENIDFSDYSAIAQFSVLNHNYVIIEGEFY